jgi:hypothetical protein
VVEHKTYYKLALGDERCCSFMTICSWVMTIVGLTMAPAVMSSKSLQNLRTGDKIKEFSHSWNVAVWCTNGQWKEKVQKWVHLFNKKIPYSLTSPWPRPRFWAVYCSLLRNTNSSVSKKNNFFLKIHMHRAVSSVCASRSSIANYHNTPPKKSHCTELHWVQYKYFTFIQVSRDNSSCN